MLDKQKIAQHCWAKIHAKSYKEADIVHRKLHFITIKIIETFYPDQPISQLSVEVRSLWLYKWIWHPNEWSGTKQGVIQWFLGEGKKVLWNGNGHLLVSHPLFCHLTYISQPCRHCCLFKYINQHVVGCRGE